jgi:hypothetical protein
MWNPLRSEQDMFRFLLQVGLAAIALVAIVLLLRAIF